MAISFDTNSPWNWKRALLVSFVINSSEILQRNWCDSVLIFKYCFSFRNTLLQNMLVTLSIACFHNFSCWFRCILWITLMHCYTNSGDTEFGISKCLQLNQIHVEMGQLCCKFPWNNLWQSEIWNKNSKYFLVEGKILFFNQFFSLERAFVGKLD